MSSDNKQEDTSDEALGDLVDALEKVNEDSPEAKLNEKTISDNNGRRIELDRNKLRGQRPVQGVFSTDRTFKKIVPEKDKPEAS